MNDKYITKDLGEATILLSVGFKLLETQWRGQVAYFVFDRKGEAEEIVHRYHFEGMTVVAKTYHDNMILIKSKILARYNPNRFRKDVRSYASNQR